jgi:hypothetical protein
VSEEQDDAIAAGHRLFEEFQIFDMDDRAELIRCETGGPGGGDQVGTGAAEADGDD